VTSEKQSRIGQGCRKQKDKDKSVGGDSGRAWTGGKQQKEELK
jgi:hypothetical protein